MRRNRFPIAYFLTLALLICAHSGGQLVFAQGSKNKDECEDQPVVSSARQAPSQHVARPRQNPPDSSRGERTINYPPTPQFGVILTRPTPHPTVEPLPVRPIFVPTPASPPTWTYESPVIPRPSITSWEPFPPIDTPTPLINFNVILADTERSYTVSLSDGTPIYEGCDPQQLCQNVNQTLKDQGVSAASFKLDGLNVQKQDAFAATLKGAFEIVNPEVAVSVLLSSPGASLIESSTEPEYVAEEGRFRSLLKIKRLGQTGSIAVFHATKERLGHFITMLRGRMSKDLKHMSVERVIKKARTDFERNYPGSEIEVKFTSESGATEWVKIKPFQKVRELWMRSSLAELLSPATA